MKIIKALIGIFAVAAITVLMLTYAAIAEEPVAEECESVYESELPVQFCATMISIGMAQAGNPNELINDPMMQYHIQQECIKQWADFLSTVYLKELQAEQ
jgi:hypothetical protein